MTELPAPMFAPPPPALSSSGRGSRQLPIRLASVFLAMACLCGPVAASQLSPCLRVLTYAKERFGQEPVRSINLCTLFLNDRREASVHEHITIATIQKYRGIAAFAASGPAWKFAYMNDPDGNCEKCKKHAPSAIVFGVWWNDDPLMRSWGQGLLDFVQGSYLSWRAITNEGRQPLADYPGGTSRCRVHPDVHLGRASHFGRLQHLHFMSTRPRAQSTPRERVAATTEAALSWMKFAYHVAIRDAGSHPETTLTVERQEQLLLPSIARNHCVKDPENVKIMTLFSRIGQKEDYRIKIVPDVALGSMLHILQDSFSPSHTCRVPQRTGSGVSTVLADVENYAEQDTDVHESLDGFPEWLDLYARENQHMLENDPIEVGVWLMEAVDKRTPWHEVETHLRNTIFALYASDEPVPNGMCMGRDIKLHKRLQPPEAPACVPAAGEPVPGGCTFN